MTTTTDGAIEVGHARGVATITINRPAARGAFTVPMLDTFSAAVERIRDDPAVRVVLLRGTGQDFCAGADTGDLASATGATPTERSDAFRDSLRTRIHPLTRSLLSLPQPLLVSARGHAIGLGAMFVLAADLVVLSETTRLSVPQVRLGHTLDHGESWLLPRRLGPAKASELALLGGRLTADDAARAGLANWVVADADLDDRTDAVVGDLLAVAPIALMRTKALLQHATRSTLDDQLAAEVDSASACAASSDFVEAIEALVARRPPSFTGA